jgi:hypothetical protein
MAAEDRIDESSNEQEPETPVCLKCFQPVSPLDHFCPNCGEAAGQFTPSLPIEGIRWQTQMWGRAWRQIWSSGVSIPGRWLRLVMVVLNAPILLIGIFWQIRPKRRHLHTGT